MKTTSYWLDDFPPPSDLGNDRLPAETDVLVVGAGNTGLTAARELATAGIAVTVVDAGDLGAGASAVNGGQVNYGLKASTQTVYRNHGAALGRRLWDASMAAIDLVEELVTADSIDCEFLRPGSVELAYRTDQLDELRRDAAWMRDHLGFETELVESTEIRRVIGSDRFVCALVDRAGGSIHPAKFVFGLARSAAALGATLVTNAPVTAISRSAAGYAATTPSGTVRAGSIIMATNGYTPEGLVPGLRRFVVPIGSYMIATAPLDPALAERLLPERRVAWTARRLLNYFKRSRDDRILIGGRQNLSVGLDLQTSAVDLRRTLTEIYPELAEVEITHSWGGVLGVTFDLLPHLGQIDGIWYALGYGGHGVGLSTYLGREVGRIVAGTQNSSVFAEVPAPTRAYYRRRPWFVPAAALMHRALDRLGR